MKLAIEQQFPVAVAASEALFFDETFWRALGEALALGRELIKLERTPERIVRHVQFEPHREPGTPADQAFGKTRAGFLEELDYDLCTHKGTWRTIPNVFTERVRTAGTLEFVAVPGGMKRIVKGDVDVKLFGFGKVVEKMIVAEIEKSYAATARFTRAWLASR